MATTINMNWHRFWSWTGRSIRHRPFISVTPRRQRCQVAAFHFGVSAGVLADP